MTAATANGITIEYETHGDPGGDPLLLIMGLGGQLTDWTPGFLDALVAEGFYVITPDNRDAGLSTEFSGEPPSLWDLVKAMIARRPIDHAYRIADMAADHVALLDELGIDAAHIAGVSMGGMISQQIAIDHPQRTLGLTSIMSTTGNPRVGRTRFRTLLHMARFRGAPKSEALEAGVANFAHISGPTFDEAEYRRVAAVSIARSYRPEGTGRQLAAIVASPDRTDGLGAVTAPTLVIHGIVDPLVMKSGGVATAKAVPGSRLILYPEMGHNIPAGRYAEIAAAMGTNAAR